MYFGHKYVETGPNCSHELATFLKYHMSLKGFEMSRKQYLQKGIIVRPLLMHAKTSENPHPCHILTVDRPDSNTFPSPASPPCPETDFTATSQKNESWKANRLSRRPPHVDRSLPIGKKTRERCQPKDRGLFHNGLGQNNMFITKICVTKNSINSRYYINLRKSLSLKLKEKKRKTNQAAHASRFEAATITNYNRSLPFNGPLVYFFS